MSKIVLCMAIYRYKNCKLKKNLCCGYCDYLPDCLDDYSKNKNKLLSKIKPCSLDDAEDCENREFIE